MAAGAGDPHVEEAALLVDRPLSLGEGDGHQPLGESCEEHRVPLQAFGRVEGGQGDALHGGGMLGGGALVELSGELAHRQVFADAAALGVELVGQGHQRGHGLPPFAHRAGAGRGFSAPPVGGEDVPDGPGHGVAALLHQR